MIISEIDGAGLGVALFALGVVDGGCGKDVMLTTFLTFFSLLGVVGLVLMGFVIGVCAVGMPDDCFLLVAAGEGFCKVGRDDADTVRAVDDAVRMCGDMVGDSDGFLGFGNGSEGRGPDGGPKDGRGNVEVVAMVGGCRAAGPVARTRSCSAVPRRGLSM